MIRPPAASFPNRLPPITGLHQHAAAPGSAAQRHIAPFVAHTDTVPRRNVQFARRPTDQSQFGLPARTPRARMVRAVIDPAESNPPRPQNLIKAPVDPLHILDGHQSPAYARLIRDYDHSKP